MAVIGEVREKDLVSDREGQSQSIACVITAELRRRGDRCIGRITITVV